jgi:vacuolar-type H+-ATPase subunit I/STV1
MTLFAGQDITPPAIAFGQAKQIGLVSAMVQGFLFVATGLAILRKMKIAVKLVWVTVALSGLGVLFRGLIPTDIFVWVLSLLLARWFTKKAREGVGVVKPAVGP